MKRFSCGDVVPGCLASWECKTEDEVLSSVAVHAADAHGLTDASAELADIVRAHIVDDIA